MAAMAATANTDRRAAQEAAAMAMQAAGMAAEKVKAEAAVTLAQCEAQAIEANAAWRKALQCALAAGEAAGLATGGGVGDREGRGVDSDLETLDDYRGPRR